MSSISGKQCTYSVPHRLCQQKDRDALVSHAARSGKMYDVAVFADGSHVCFSGRPKDVRKLIGELLVEFFLSAQDGEALENLLTRAVDRGQQRVQP